MRVFRSGIGISLLAGAWLLAAPLGTGCAPRPLDRDDGALPRDADDALDLLVSWMSGSFTSDAQATRDPDYRGIFLHMAPIWPDRPDGRWLYVEQATAESPEAPYRQRVYRVARLDDATFVSEVHELLVDPRTVVGAWRDPALLQGLDPQALARREGCDVILTLVGHAFIGSTRDQDCPSTLRGAAWASSEVRISADGIDSWDRGWTASGEQAWGAEKGAYEFRRR